jgi:hypothetical protein
MVMKGKRAEPSSVRNWLWHTAARRLSPAAYLVRSSYIGLDQVQITFLGLSKNSASIFLHFVFSDLFFRHRRYIPPSR